LLDAKRVHAGRRFLASNNNFPQPAPPKILAGWSLISGVLLPCHPQPEQEGKTL